MDHVFYEFKVNPNSDLAINLEIEIILHFLAKEDQHVILYETRLTIEKTPDSRVEQEVIDTLQKIFSQLDTSISLVNGKIREIFMSYS